MAAPRWYNTLIYGLGTSLVMYKTMRDFEMDEYANIVGGTFLCLTLYWTVEAELAWKEALRRAREAEEEEGKEDGGRKDGIIVLVEKYRSNVQDV